MKILYIAGYGRSGTTILDNVLGQVEGFTTVGEMRYIWDRGIQKNWTCGCLREFSMCPFWHSVLNTGFGEDQQAIAANMLSYRDPLRRIHRFVTKKYSNDQQPFYNRDQFVEGLGRLYRAVSEISGADLIIDSSKWPSYGRYLSEIPGVDLRIVHLVRDPRAVAFSWQREKAYDPYLPEPFYIRRLPSTRVALEWRMWNAAAEGLQKLGSAKYCRVRYEDFVSNPEPVIGDLLSFLGEEDIRTPLHAPDSIVLADNHCVAGNPIRFQRGEIRISADDEWKEKQSALDRLIVGSITSHLMRKYGYVKPKAASSKVLLAR